MKYFLWYVAGGVVFAGTLAVYFLSNALPSAAPETYTTFPTAPEATTSSPTVVDQAWRRDPTAVRVPQAPVVSDVSAIQLAPDFYKVSDDDDVYSMYYDTVTGSLTIMLFQTPLTFARTFAEKKLRTMFTESDESICAMDIVVMTNSYVDPRYAGYDLGLSFCPGSVVLE